MEIKYSRHPDYCFLALIGQFWEQKDFTAFDASVELSGASGVCFLAADISRVSFLSSQALGRLVRVYSRWKEAGKQFVLIGPSGSVKETLSLAQFDVFMTIFGSPADFETFVKSKVG